MDEDEKKYRDQISKTLIDTRRLCKDVITIIQDYYQPPRLYDCIVITFFEWILDEEPNQDTIKQHWDMLLKDIPKTAIVKDWPYSSSGWKPSPQRIFNESVIYEYRISLEGITEDNYRHLKEMEEEFYNKLINTPDPNESDCPNYIRCVTFEEHNYIMK